MRIVPSFISSSPVFLQSMNYVISFSQGQNEAYVWEVYAYLGDCFSYLELSVCESTRLHQCISLTGFRIRKWSTWKLARRLKMAREAQNLATRSLKHFWDVQTKKKQLGTGIREYGWPKCENKCIFRRRRTKIYKNKQIQIGELNTNSLDLTWAWASNMCR